MALTDNLISYWKFDESSGNASDELSTNDLTNNDTCTYATGHINNAVTTASAATRWMSKSSPTDIPGGGNQGEDLSVSFWLKINTFPGSNISDALVAVWDHNSGTNRSWALQFTHFAGGAKSLRFFSRDAANNNYWTDVTVTGVISEGTWYHIVITFDGSTATKNTWVDASSIDGPEAGQGNTLRNVTPDFTVGSNDGGEYADASFDEMGVWDRVLTDEEIGELYNSGDGLAYPFV